MHAGSGGCRIAGPRFGISWQMGGASAPATQVRLQPQCCPCETARGAVASSSGKAVARNPGKKRVCQVALRRVCVVLLNGGQILRMWNQYLGVFASYGAVRLGTVGAFHVEIGRVLIEASNATRALIPSLLSVRDLHYSWELGLVGGLGKPQLQSRCPWPRGHVGGLPRPVMPT